MAIDETDVLTEQVIKNALREDLRPIEQARAFKRLMDLHGWSARRLAEGLHIDHDKVSRAVRLLGLPEDIQVQVEAGAIPPSAAAEIARAPDEETRRELASQAAAGDLTRDEVTARVRAVSSRSGGGKGRGAKAKPRKVTSRTLKTSAGYKVTVEHRRGIDAAGIRAALLEAADQLGDAGEGRGEAA